jgi:transmembrane sensor
VFFAASLLTIPAGCAITGKINTDMRWYCRPLLVVMRIISFAIMSSNPLRLRFLFKKYIADTCSAEELKELWELIAHLGHNDFLSDDIKKLWEAEHNTSATRQINWSSVYDQVLSQIAQHPPPAISILSKKVVLIRRAAIAASLLFAVACGGWWLTRQLPVTHPVAKAATAPALHQMIILPDGSMVTLNTGSKLNYPTVFNGSTRDVYLTGEAYFDVKHNNLQPFIVHSGVYATVVLGTAFNIKAYPAENSMAITVEKGKVKVENTNNKRSFGILVAGDQLVINKNTVTARIQKADVQKVLQWEKEELLFDNITFAEASVILSNRYGIELMFENERLRNCRFTCKFSSEDTVDEVLDVICTLTHAKWNREDKSVIRLSGTGCMQ